MGTLIPFFEIIGCRNRHSQQPCQLSSVPLHAAVSPDNALNTNNVFLAQGIFGVAPMVKIVAVGVKFMRLCGYLYIIKKRLLASGRSSILNKNSSINIKG